jgi:putative membrane protein
LWRELRRWRGVLLIGVISIGTVWLAINNELVLYIHPRYVVFTVIMAVVALAFAVARVIVSGRRALVHDDHDHEDDEDDDDLDARPLQRVLSIGALVLAAALATGAVLLPPATLSAATAAQRDITDVTVNTDAASLDDAESADAATFARYTVVEWSSLLAQSSDPAFYAGKQADIIGFITPDPHADDVFYISRFSITCCAVDAQPIGVPVYLPDWQSQFHADDWVEVTGQFGANHSAESTAVIALNPTGVTGVDQPADPYLY